MLQNSFAFGANKTYETEMNLFLFGCPWKLKRRSLDRVQFLLKNILGISFVVKEEKKT